MYIFSQKNKIALTIIILIITVKSLAQTVLFQDNFNQTPVNPIVSSGQPTANYSIWTTVSPTSAEGGTALIEDFTTGDGVIKLLARNSPTTQTGDRTEVSAPLSVYNTAFKVTLNTNTKNLEWIFTLKQNRSSAGGTSGFTGTNTGMAVVLVSDSSRWGSQQGSLAKGYTVTLLKPNGSNYCVTLSKFSAGLTSSSVIAGNKVADIFSDNKNWITVKVSYSPTTNEWNLYFRDEKSTVVKGDVNSSANMKLIDTVIDSTYTKTKMTHFGFALNTPAPSTSGANANAFYIDDFSVKHIESAAEQFTLNATGEGGVVNVSPKLTKYSAGSQVTLTAVPDQGYIFEKWSGDVSGFHNPISAVVSKNMNIVANYIPTPQELVVKKKLIHYDVLLLDTVKNEIKSNNAYFVSAYNSLISSANSEFNKTANPVTNKSQTPPSGNMHDYYSIAPYFWPDPTKTDGLPWINKDGQVNPLTRGDNTDQVRLSEFLNSIEILSLAYYFSDDTRYAFKAIELLNIWLVNADTKMNPHANYAQGVPGANTGRQIGIIEFGEVYNIIAAMQIMENKGILSATTKLNVDNWLKEWSVWLRTSEFGILEGQMTNNHATWYDYQVLGLLLYENKITEATQLVNNFKTKRIASQIQTNGSQPLELGRTKSVNYSTMNLWGMTKVAQMGQQVGVNLWNYVTTDGRSIKKAFDFLRPYVLNPTTWTWEQITSGGKEEALNTITKPLFCKASTILREDLIAQSTNPSENLSYIEKLVFPPREKIIISSIAKNPVAALNVFPNPSKGKFKVQVNEPVSYKVYNMGGVLVKAGKADGSFELDLSNFNNGITILKIETATGVNVQQLVKID